MEQRNRRKTDRIAQELHTLKPEQRRKAFWVGMAIIASIAVCAVLWVAWGLQQRERQYVANLQKRMELLASSQVQMVEAMLQVNRQQADRVIRSELFRLYAAEIDLVDDDVSRIVAGPLPGHPLNAELSQLAAQLPMMQNLLLEFTRISGHIGGRVVNRNGTVYIATDAATTPLRPDQAEMVRRVLASRQEQFGPLRHTAHGLVLESFLPIFSPGGSSKDAPPVAVLLLSKAVSDRMSELSSGNRLIEKGEGIRLVQKVPAGYEEIVPWLPGELRPVGVPLALDEGQRLLFSDRPSLSGEQRVYSVGLPVPNMNWWIVAEADYDIAREGLRGERRVLISIATLLIMVFTITFGAVWAKLVGNQDRKMALYFEGMADRIESQRQLLDRINNTIADLIGLKDLQGRYQYVNPAFARAVGRAPEELLGLDDEAIFGYDTARRLEPADHQVQAGSELVTTSETIYLQSHRHHLQISKSPLKDAEGRMTGIVSVIRDITEMVEAQRRQEQATQKTVEALVRAVELTDPYLAGHSRLMGALAVEVAKTLHAGALEIATLETAANLSQIGKLFVDRALLFKSEVLTPEEKKAMEQHVAHAAKVLHGIDFGLPIYDAVVQMNENADGSGYPKGLKGEEIGFPARVLAAVNSFCAMVEPRAYRGARTIDEALRILRDSGAAYDQQVVAALDRIVHSALGEKLLARHVAEQ
ncbi:MAG: PAS domain S-box protein [Deltaproteobacteria bacterium]|nr:MAG: PAS domain S-box protein [Deltaproteobacteria bacterium]